MYYAVAAALQGDDSIPKPPPPSSEVTKEGRNMYGYTIYT